MAAMQLFAGCGPAPKSESVKAYESFLASLYSNDIPRLLSMLTPVSRRELSRRLGLDQGKSAPLEGSLMVELGWEFERVSARAPKLVGKRSRPMLHVISADLGGELWHIVMDNTADGWKLDLFGSKPVAKETPPSG